MEKEDIQIKLGPSGYLADDWDDGAHQKIEKILIGYSDQGGIRYIQAVYSDSDNIEMLGPRHGSDAQAASFKMINITKPVTRIDGTYGAVKDFGVGMISCITSLEFSSSEGSSGLIGRKSENSFTFESDLEFSGFHGHANGRSLTSLGVYINTSVKKYLSPSSN